MKPVELGLETLAEALGQSGIVVLDFWAPWCGPCRAFAPVFEASARRHPDVLHGKIDTDAQGAIAQRFQIRSIPTVMVFRDGVRVFSQPGMLAPAALDRVIAATRALDVNDLRRPSGSPSAA